MHTYYTLQEMGECRHNSQFMLANCAKACGACDNRMSRATSGTRRETSAAANDLLLRRTAKFGVLQTADDHEYEQAILDTIENMMEYFESNNYKSLPSNIKKNCKNDVSIVPYRTLWAGLGWAVPIISLEASKQVTVGNYYI